MTDVLYPPTTNSIQPESPLQVELNNARANLAKMQSDWNKLNELMNAHADHENWCSEYDDKLETWNERFELLNLTTRMKQFDVRVKVTATYYASVSVKAKNDDDAVDIVNETYGTDVIMTGHRSWTDYEDVEWEATEAEQA